LEERSRQQSCAAGRTRVIYEPRPLSGVNEAIEEVLLGKAKARLVLHP